MAEADCTVKVDCRICGDAFEYQRLPGPGRLRRFCSPECKVEAASSAGRAVACATCGNEFNRRHAGQIVCGLSCRRRGPFIGPRNRKVSRPPLREVACCGCGVTQSRRMRCDEAGRYCGVDCYAKARARVGAEIDALYRIGSRARHPPKLKQKAWLSPDVLSEIRALRRIGRRKERQIRTERGCGTCGTPVIGLLNWPRTCAACKTEAQRKHRRISRAARRARINGRRRDPIDPIAVFERDGWLCYLCGTETPMALRGTLEPNAPELEHKLAIANGGTHTWDNVACACRRCNGLKGASVLPMAA